MNCHACGRKLEGAIVDMVWSGFESDRLNGVHLRLHARCVRLVATEPEDLLVEAALVPERATVEVAATPEEIAERWRRAVERQSPMTVGRP